MGARSEADMDALHRDLLLTADYADAEAMRGYIDQGADINRPDALTGLTALHLAVGRNALDAVRLLVDRGAKFVPDGFGRMPSVIAAECEVDDDLADYILEAEAAAEDV
jgi:ankyrin repeat protein